MTVTACRVNGCAKPPRTRGLCASHYHRLRRYGDPLGGSARKILDPEEAFLARTEPLIWSDCIIWTGATTGRGYGAIAVDGKQVSAHRYAYEREHGPIPRGALIDHSCWNRSCVNVDHLRLATPSQNVANKSKINAASGYRNVYASGKKWRVVVTRAGERRTGAFTELEDAVAAAAEWREAAWAEFAGKGHE